MELKCIQQRADTGQCHLEATAHQLLWCLPDSAHQQNGPGSADRYRTETVRDLGTGQSWASAAAGPEAQLAVETRRTGCFSCWMVTHSKHLPHLQQQHTSPGCAVHCPFNMNTLRVPSSRHTGGSSKDRHHVEKLQVSLIRSFICFRFRHKHLLDHFMLDLQYQTEKNGFSYSDAKYGNK